MTEHPATHDDTWIRVSRVQVPYLPRVGGYSGGLHKILHRVMYHKLGLHN